MLFLWKGLIFQSGLASNWCVSYTCFSPKYLSVVEMILSLITLFFLFQTGCSWEQCHNVTHLSWQVNSGEVLISFPPNPIFIKDSPSWGARGGPASALTSSQPPPGTRGHISVWWTGNRNHLVPTPWPCRVITNTRHRTLTQRIQI